MTPGIADTLNRNAARTFAALLDVRHAHQPFDPWYHQNIARTLMGENAATDADRAWLVGQLAGTAFDGPADEDWESFYSYLRAEITARRDRDSESPRPEAGLTAAGGEV